MNISLFNYHLPEHLIAKYPAEKRDESKLLVYDRKKDIITNIRFKQIPEFFYENDVLVANNVKVIPARLFGKKETGGKVEILLIKKINGRKWQAILNSSKKMKKNSRIYIDNLKLTVSDIIKNEYIIEFDREIDYKDLFDISAQMPIPPYLKRNGEDIDKERYQTVFSDEEKQGAIAAPTAGLHFTNEIFDRLKERKVEIVFITLYVGLGTFMPVRVEDIKEHKMHEEVYEISEITAKRLNIAMEKGKNIVAVGTTTVRALEDNFLNYKKIKSGSFSTDIFIYPGYKFNVVNKLITNFHLPKSTLLMLVSAFAGRENILKCYEVAIQEKYRFFSYGDCMLII